MPIVISDPEPGVVKVCFVGTLDDAQFSRYLEAMQERLRIPQPVAMLYDVGRDSINDRHHVKLQGAWLKSNREALQQYTLGIAFALGSVAHRFLLSSVFMIQKPPAPYVVTGSVEEAYAWCAGLARPVVSTRSTGPTGPTASPGAPPRRDTAPQRRAEL